MKKIEKLIGVIVALFMPMVAMAAGLVDTIGTIKNILNLVIGLLFVLVTVYFIWGVMGYIFAGGEEKKLEEGKRHMIWGIIGMAVMAGAWGLVNILLQTFGISNQGIPTIPGTGGVVGP